MKIQANGIAIEVEDSASTASDPDHRQRPVVLLITGLGLQLIAWPDAWVQALVDAGYRVLRFDNRDIGLSSAMDHLGQPNMAWAMTKLQLGLAVHTPYTVGDMAADALGVLDALGIASTHVVGLSMGGMIAQRLALAAPQRVRSLCCIMSSSGAKGLPGPQAAVLKVMMRRVRGTDEAAVVEHTLQLFQAIASPAYPMEPQEVRQQIVRAYRRSYRPVGTQRQMLAVLADRSRAAALSALRTPTLVLHGRADPLVPFACGADLARRIPGAELRGIDGMGHDLPPPVVQHLLAALLPHLQSAQLRTATAA